jgi:hypothetical protein
VFDFDDRGEVVKLAVSWLCFASAMPVYWWLAQGDGIFLQMLRTVEGWAYFGGCFLVALMCRPLLNRLVRTGSASS